MTGSAEPGRGDAILNAVGGFLAGYGFVVFFCFIGIERHWAGTAPTVPDLSLGAIFRHDDHGDITYFTAFQATSCALLFETSIPLAMIGALIARKKNVKSRSGFLWWRAAFYPDDPNHIFKWAFALGALAAPAMVFLLGPSLVQWLIAHGLAQRF